MPKSTRNSGSNWTPTEIRELGKLARQNTPTRVIGLKLGRTPAAIYTRAAQEGISLSLPNRSPYERRR